MDAIPLDTTIDAARKQFEILRRLGPEVRLKMAFELSDNLRSLVEAGVRQRHPDFDEQRVQQEVLRLMVGETLFRQMRPDAKI
jgi:DNA-binding HxlR family transcriptional regulator